MTEAARRRARAAAIACALATAATVAAAERPPAEQYQLHCSGCHGPNGDGVPGTVPGLHALSPLLETAGGREYLARVPGVAQAPVNDAELATLLNWVLSELSGAALREPYSEVEVGRLREQPLRDPAAARAAIRAAATAPAP